jgi:hypothetical protein
MAETFTEMVGMSTPRASHKACWVVARPSTTRVRLSIRTDIAPRWVMPAGQRLQTPDRPVSIDDRLVGDIDAAVCYRLPEDFDKAESVKAGAVVGTERGDPPA